MTALRNFSIEDQIEIARRREMREVADYCTHEGALTLKARIEAYWAARGHQVMVGLSGAGFDVAVRAARFDVRSNLVNGLPNRK